MGELGMPDRAIRVLIDGVFCEAEGLAEEFDRRLGVLVAQGGNDADPGGHAVSPSCPSVHRRCGITSDANISMFRFVSSSDRVPNCSMVMSLPARVSSRSFES